MSENLDNYVISYREFPYFDDNTAVLEQYSKKIIDNLLLCKSKKSVCILGIGYGIVLKNILLKARDSLEKLVIIEGSKKLCDEYSPLLSQYSNVELVYSYFEYFSTKERFDIIEMGFVLEHVDDPKRTIMHFLQFLGSGGKICSAVPNALSLNRILGHRAGLLDDMYSLSRWDHQLGHKRYFDSDSFRQVFIECGLEIINENGLSLKPFTTEQMRSLNLSKDVLNALYISGDLAPRYAYSIYLEALKR